MDPALQPSCAGGTLSRQVLGRAAVVAAIIGGVLTVLNQSDAVFGTAEIRRLPLILVFVTPFLVISASQILGARAACRAAARRTARRNGFLGTLFSHGIPARAITLGVAAGSVNTAIVASAGLLAGRGLDQLPVPLILQALTLPAVLGALSQALSFHRTLRQTAHPQ